MLQGFWDAGRADTLKDSSAHWKGRPTVDANDFTSSYQTINPALQ
jgi:hypothetical protein